VAPPTGTTSKPSPLAGGTSKPFDRCFAWWPADGGARNNNDGQERRSSPHKGFIRQRHNRGGVNCRSRRLGRVTPCAIVAGSPPGRPPCLFSARKCCVSLRPACIERCDPSNIRIGRVAWISGEAQAVRTSRTDFVSGTSPAPPSGQLQRMADSRDRVRRAARRNREIRPTLGR